MTRIIRVKDVYIGGNHPISIQSMCNTKTTEVEKTIAQIHELEQAGCEIVRLAIPSIEAANALSKIVPSVSIPIVADIHFDYRLALYAMENGVHKLRINPGNIGKKENVIQVVKMAQAYNVPIRIGVNSGSIEPNLQKQYGVSAMAMYLSAKNQIELLEELGFHDICVSLKASNVKLSIEAYELFSQNYDYPLHVGITEAGTLYTGAVKSAVGLGAILSKGIGDTIRVSLSDHPTKEIECAKLILSTLDLRRFNNVKIISCPTCGRTEINLIELANRIENYTKNYNVDMKVAVMGCAVNGPGEAREADLGIAGGKGAGVIFSKGQIIRKVAEDDLFSVFCEEFQKFIYQ
ncbi:MAG: 4-hydroxy-3-methylbut-2-en-1-yl diphosphate synthase [Candidatus Epulonipiscioides saccharophilum]|nr:MAG: 4-hydroxy-3-methylbut-2-en-1-yl diphosphate synthase [Epulopiscium sp. AS2M-Bin001]